MVVRRGAVVVTRRRLARAIDHDDALPLTVALTRAALMGDRAALIRHQSEWPTPTIRSPRPPLGVARCATAVPTQPQSATNHRWAAGG